MRYKYLNNILLLVVFGSLISLLSTRVYAVSADVLTATGQVRQAAETVVSFDWSTTNQQVLNQHIMPRYIHLSQTSMALRALVDKDCARQQKIDVVPPAWRVAFMQLWQAWADVQHIRFGPMSYQQRYERIHYWPDKHNRGARQLQQLLRQDISRIDAISFANKSVAVQGFSAFERVLYSLDEEQLNHQLCQISRLISDNLATISVANLQSWQQGDDAFQQAFLQFSQADAIFASNEVLATQLLNDLSTQLLVIKELKLSRAFALPQVQAGAQIPAQLETETATQNSPQVKSRPKRLEAWRSRQSLALLKINLLASQSLYQSGFELHVRKVNKLLHLQIAGAFQRSLEAIDAFEQPLYDCLLNLPCTPFVELVRQLEVLQPLITEDMRHYLALQYSFNSLDGD